MTGLSPRAFQLSFRGSFVRIRLAVNAEHEAAFIKSEGRAPEPIPFLALIDTGASRTAVPPGTFARLGVEPTTDERIAIAGRDPVRLPAYRGRVLLQGATGVDVEIPSTAVEMTLGGSVECLIGRDTLAHGMLSYNGREGFCGLVLKGMEIPLVEFPYPAR